MTRAQARGARQREALVERQQRAGAPGEDRVGSVNASRPEVVALGRVKEGGRHGMKSQRVDSGHEGGAAAPRRSRRKAAALPVEQGPEVVVVAAEAAPADASAQAVHKPLEPAAFFQEVMALGSVEAACAKSGMSLEAYTRARLTNEAFDEAALMADQVLDLRVVDQVRKAAQQEGGLASQTLYFRAVRTEAVQAPFPSLRRARPGLDDAPALPPEVAAAIIKAGLEAHEKVQQGTTVAD